MLLRVQTNITVRQIEIIDAAGKLLTQSGLNGLTIKNLAQAMQFSESAIYRHFDSKHEIIIGMLNYLAAALDQLFSTAYSQEDALEDQLKKLLHTNFLFFKAHPHFVVVVFSDGLFEDSIQAKEAMHNIMATLLKHVTPIVVQSQASGLFTNDLNGKEIIHLLMGSIRLQMFKWRMSNFGFDIVEAANKRVANLLTLIK